MRSPSTVQPPRPPPVAPAGVHAPHDVGVPVRQHGRERAVLDPARRSGTARPSGDRVVEHRDLVAERRDGRTDLVDEVATQLGGSSRGPGSRWGSRPGVPDRRGTCRRRSSSAAARWWPSGSPVGLDAEQVAGVLACASACRRPTSMRAISVDPVLAARPRRRWRRSTRRPPPSPRPAGGAPERPPAAGG